MFPLDKEGFVIPGLVEGGWVGRCPLGLGDGVGLVQDDLLSVFRTVPGFISGWLGCRVGCWVSQLGWKGFGIVLDNCCGGPGWVYGTLNGPSKG